MDFRILGPLEVREDGRELSLGKGRQRALLAILLLSANEFLSTDRLVDELWGEHPPPTASKIVQNYVSQLRRALGESRLVTRGRGYVLEVEPGTLDLELFESGVRDGSRALAGGDPRRASEELREALSLWRGPALAEFAYEPFAQPAIARLDELRLEAIEDRIEAELALGLHSELIGELEELVDRNPLRERLRVQLMLALYRSGRQAEALEVYRDARSALVEELALEPGKELQTLERQILEHDPALDLPQHPASPTPALEIATSPPAAVVRDRGRVKWPLVIGAVGVLLAAGAAAAMVVAVSDNSAHHVFVAANSVAVIDPKSGRLVDAVPVGSRPIAIAVGQGGVWVANADDGTVSRIDPKTRRVVKNIGTGAPASDLAVGAGGVWVANGSEGTLTQIDPRTNTVLHTFDLSGPNKLAPQGVYSVTTGAGAVWAGSGSHRVLKIDPATGTVSARIDVGLTPVDIAFQAGNLWVARLGGRVLRIDAVTARKTGTDEVAPNAVAIAVGEGGVWVADARLGGSGLVWSIDPETVTTLGIAALSHTPGGIATGGGAVWVAGGLAGTLVKIDPGSGQVSGVIRVGHAPLDVAYGDGTLWVTVGAKSAAT